jgi:DNA-binding transcriptional regulator LsrR (DeoR family)
MVLMVEEIRKQRKAGRPSSDKTPSKTELARFYIRERKSIREVAEALNCSKDMVHRALAEYGIKRRTKGQRRLKLKDYDLSFLHRGVRKKGQVKVAEELGVNQSTLSRYLRKGSISS